MFKAFLALVAVLSFAAIETQAQVPSTPSINPSVAAQPVRDGHIVTPSVDLNVPLGDGANLKGNITAPILIPNSGSPQVFPQFSIGVRIPL